MTNKRYQAAAATVVFRVSGCLGNVATLFSDPLKAQILIKNHQLLQLCTWYSRTCDQNGHLNVILIRVSWTYPLSQLKSVGSYMEPHHVVWHLQPVQERNRNESM